MTAAKRGQRSKRSQRGKNNPTDGVAPAVVELGAAFQQAANDAWVHPFLGKSAKDSAFERAVDIATNQKPPIVLTMDDMLFLKACNAVPVSNRDGKLNASIRADKMPPGANTFTCKFEVGGVTTTFEVYLPPLDTMAAAFRIHACEMDVSHVQTYVYRHFYNATEQHPSKFLIGKMNKIRFRAREPAGDVRKAHAHLLAELQRAEIVRFLGKHYVVDPILPVEIANATSHHVTPVPLPVPSASASGPSNHRSRWIYFGDVGERRAGFAQADVV